MFDLFDPPGRRVKDARKVGYYFTKYGKDALDILSERAEDASLSPRDRRHWRRLARKARRRQSEWMDKARATR